MSIRTPHSAIVSLWPVLGFPFHAAPGLPGQQAAFWCRSCGSDALLAGGLCRACYDRRRHSHRFFGGQRERVLRRDGCCQLCLARERLLVHHRHPGQNRRHSLPDVYSELFLQLWREQHPELPVQGRLFLL